MSFILRILFNEPFTIVYVYLKKTLQPPLLNMTAFVVVYMLTCYICVLFCMYW